MAQSTPLAAGLTAATSTDVAVTAGTPKLVGLFVAAGVIPQGVMLQVMQDTPGADFQVGVLTRDNPRMVLEAPGTYRVVRPLLAVGTTAVGVFAE